jgi:hypothetical protein
VAGVDRRATSTALRFTWSTLARVRYRNTKDAPRFYALRLHDAGMIKSSPNTIISERTDWRFVHELKREPKA